MNTIAKLWLAFIFMVVLPAVFFLYHPDATQARNVQRYSDTITDSGPSASANHTFTFDIDTEVSPGGRLEFTMPDGFQIASSSQFDIRNIELYVNGFARPAAAVAAPGLDQVEFTVGSPGFIRYTLAPDFTILAGSHVEVRVGNRTSGSLSFSETYSSTTNSTTTVLADIPGIINSATIGTHEVRFEIWDNGLTANAGFLIAVVNKVYAGRFDTTEDIPPYRFNGAPTSSVGGTTLSVEISLETDEFAICRYSLSPDTPFGSMPHTFTNTGLIFHTTVVSVAPNTVQSFYVRCLDDEGNYNIDDFLIRFTVDQVPTGTANTTGSTSGNGSGSGNSGTGTGSGGGGTTGGSSGVAPSTGGASGSGGSGGGSGGGGNSGSGGGGGSSGSGSGNGNDGFGSDAQYRSGDAQVVISGYAFPNSTVTILVDGKVAKTARSNGNGAYTGTIDAIARGVYTFGVYAESADKVKSSTFSTSFSVVGARTSELTNINVAPTIKVSPDPVDPGQTLTVSGYALPNATLAIQNSKAKTKAGSDIAATSDSSGRWSTTISTNGFSKGSYQIRAKATLSSGITTNFSEYTLYGVGEKISGPLNADLSRDGKVNLTDFSILLYWWGGNGGDSDPPADINRDGKVNLTDFSILLFNWTG